MNIHYDSGSNSSFSDFLFKDRWNRTVLLIAAIAVVIQFSIFKYFYPFASFIHGDSFVYVQSAQDNVSINTYLVGYSMFLRLLSVFSRSDLFLTALQYLLIQASTLLLLFSTFYFYRLHKWTKVILLTFIVFNPLFLFLSNMVSSDPLFFALSMTWVSSLLWIIYRPSYKIAAVYAIMQFLAFTVRYNALIYCFISLIAFLLSNWELRKRVITLVVSACLIGLFVLNTGYHYKKLTGTWQYAPFSGWQLANNAMYAYRYVDSADRKPVPARFQALDKRIREYFDSTRDTKKFIQETLMANTLYMWSPSSPLYVYRNSLFKKDTAATELKKWASMGPLYSSYGMYIIRTYPQQFLHYFLWPNANKYYAPPIEFLSTFNSGSKTVDLPTAEWFRYDSTKITTRTKNSKIDALNAYPYLSGAVNMVMLLGLIFYFSLVGFKAKDGFTKGLILVGSVWFLNALFTIFASPAALRFQSFPIILTTVYLTVLVDWMAKVLKAGDHQIIPNMIENQYQL